MTITKTSKKDAQLKNLNDHPWGSINTSYLSLAHDPE